MKTIGAFIKVLCPLAGANGLPIGNRQVVMIESENIQNVISAAEGNPEICI